MYIFFFPQAFYVQTLKTLVEMWTRIWVHSQMDFKSQDNLKYDLFPINIFDQGCLPYRTYFLNALLYVTLIY